MHKQDDNLYRLNTEGHGYVILEHEEIIGVVEFGKICDSVVKGYNAIGLHPTVERVVEALIRKYNFNYPRSISTTNYTVKITK